MHFMLLRTHSVSVRQWSAWNFHIYLRLSIFSVAYVIHTENPTSKINLPYM